MSFLNKFFLALTSLLFLVAALPGVAQASPPEPDPPPGYYLVASTTGINLYRKDYRGGTPDYVQVIDMRRGAGVKSLNAAVNDPRPGKGVYGGNDATFRRNSLNNFWSNFSARTPTAFCVANGQFFYMPEYPGPMPFPLKSDGVILTDGYAIKEFVDNKLIWEIWPDRTDIQPLSQESLYSSTAPEIIAGLTEEASKRKPRYVGRTFVGIDDRDGNGTFETILIFNTLSARQIDAANALRSFGADKVMMLDGGGSTQLLCQGRSYISSERLIPQALGIFGGSDPPPTQPDRAEAPAPAGPEVAAAPPPADAPPAAGQSPAELAAQTTPPPAAAVAAPPAEAPPAEAPPALAPAATPIVGALVQPLDDVAPGAAAPAATRPVVAPTPAAESADIILPVSPPGKEPANAAQLGAAGLARPADPLNIDEYSEIDLRGALLVPLMMAPFALVFFFAILRLRQTY